MDWKSLEPETALRVIRDHVKRWDRAVLVRTEFADEPQWFEVRVGGTEFCVQARREGTDAAVLINDTEVFTLDEALDVMGGDGDIG